MTNTLGNYDPNFYAANALIQLEKALGLAGRVHRGYDKNPQEYGSVINLRRPTYFTAQTMPISSANTSNLNPDNVAISLDQWYGTQIGLTDKELAYTQERIINEHIRPMASAVADQMDLSLNQLATTVPWYFVAANTGTATGVSDIPALRRRLFENKVPLNDVALELNPEREQWFLSQDTFVKANEAGSSDAQMRGSLGRKFGFEIFANQNVQAQPAGGSLAETGAGSFSVSATLTVGATSITIAASTMSGTLKVGDIIQVGHVGTDGLSGSALTVARNFVVTANATATSDAIVVSILPKVQVAASAGSSAHIVLQATTKYDNLAFHRNAFALAMAPLPETARILGAQVATVLDPITGLSLRSTMWYDGLDAKVYVRIDALWGIKTLNADMAVRYVS